MRRESRLKRRLRSLEALGEAVGAMKSLSAHHFREARGAVEPARAYREGIGRFLGGSGATLAASDGPAGLLLRLADDVLTAYVGERLSSFEIVSSRFGGVGVDRPERLRLLPFSAERSAAVPAARYVSAETLASAVLGEFLYITLFDLLLDALAAEHGARLVAIQAAERWLDQPPAGSAAASRRRAVRRAPRR